MILVVWLQVREKQEKRLPISLSILICIEIANCCIRNGIHAITGQFHWLVIMIVHHRIIRPGLELQKISSQPILVSTAFIFGDRVLVRQMPFADIASGISGLPEIMR